MSNDPSTEAARLPGKCALSLCSFDKSKLKKTETKVTTIDGRELIEGRDEIGRVVVTQVNSGGLGYVGDLCADLQVGEILPGLILGSQDVAQEKELLEKYGVTHILNLATLVENVFPSSYTYKDVNLLDLPTTNIIPKFDEAFEFIETGRKTGCVLVHCNAGISRAATVVIGYLIQTEGMSDVQAYEYVKERRPRICPNPGFRCQLETFYEWKEGEKKAGIKIELSDWVKTYDKKK